MEEEKAAAYYDELTRKGGGAARFKQGLGFSSSSPGDEPPTRGSALPSSSTSSFLSTFVRASSPSKTKQLEKESQLQNIQNKLKKKEPTSIDDGQTRVSNRDRDRDVHSPRRRSKSKERDRHSKRSRSRSRSTERRRRSRERERERERERDRERGRDKDRDRRKRRRSRSSSSSHGERRHRRERARSRSYSPRDHRRSEKDGEDDGRKERKMVRKEGSVPVDYAKLIDGYDNMTPAERIKAKMKLQLSQTAQKDAKIGTGSGWERFEFDKDAPVDDEEIEAADDDAAVVKHINQSFRFTSLEAKREDDIRAAHDEAMFGAPVPAEAHTSDSEERMSENEYKETHEDDVDPAISLINEKVLAKQRGSWRDRARKNVG